METLHGVETYIAGGAPPGIETSGSTIIFYTDAFGLKLVNNKLLADAYAIGTHCRVLVPDIIPGGPMDPAVMPIMDRVMTPVGLFNVPGQLARAWSLVRALSYFVPFFWRAFPSYKASYAPCLAYARKVRAGLPAGAKMGVAGFCWGGHQSLKLCTESAAEGGGGEQGLVDAQFCAHPSGLKMPDDVVQPVLRFKTPVAVAHAQEDFQLPTKKVEEAEALLRQEAGDGQGENGFYYQIRIYEGVQHGFAVRAKPGDEKEASGADEATVQAIEWFKRWL